MDFNDLSQRWQQQPPAPNVPSPAALQALLAARPHTPIARMRYNVWFEIGSTLVFGLLVVAGLHLAHAPHLGWLLPGLLLYGGVGYCYVRALQVLRRLGRATEALASHVAQQLRQLRQFEQLYHYSVMLTTLVVLGLAGYVAIGQVLPVVPAAGKTSFLVWLALTMLVSYGLTHWLSRRHLQNFYGQHLDRLEAVLRELRDETSGTAAMD